MQRIKRKGYVRSTVESERKIYDKEKKVDLAIRIEPGPQYLFGKLSVEGLDIISEPYIRKLWSMKPGQPYDAEYPYYFLKRVEEDGIFENLGKTRTALHIDDQSKIVDVSLFFSGSGKPLPKVGPGADKPKPY
jgi:outer membrane translocation and assembly module TamA